MYRRLILCMLLIQIMNNKFIENSLYYNVFREGRDNKSCRRRKITNVNTTYLLLQA